MLGRQASSYGRKFLFGSRIPEIPELVRAEPSIGLLPPEFDDLEYAEVIAVEEARARTER